MKSLQSSIEKIWYSRSKIRWLLWPFHLFFLLLVQSKSLLYRHLLLTQHRFDKPLLVVGNITLGGTGKTPFINQLVRLLAQHNIKAGIVSRGYRSQVAYYPHQISTSDQALQIGDEAFMQFNDLNVVEGFNIPLVIDPNRPRAVEYLTNNNQVDIVISDDGLQHYKMARDIEVVLFAGDKQFGNQLILPFGPLREPVSRLKRADFVIQNGQQENYLSDFKVHLSACKLVHLTSQKTLPVNAFIEQPINAVAGIANPNNFFRLLQSLVNIKTTTQFSDHHLFSAQDFQSFGDEIVLMTEKDATKCYPFALENWYYLKVEMIFNQELETRLIEAIKKIIKSQHETLV